MHLPWHHFYPAKTISNFDASNMNGTLAISASATAIFTNFCITASSKAIQHTVVNIDVNHVLSSILNLLPRNIHSCTEVASYCHHPLLELDRAAEIASLTHDRRLCSRSFSIVIVSPVSVTTVAADSTSLTPNSMIYMYDIFEHTESGVCVILRST